MSGKARIEAVVDELLALPPGQFTEARNAAAKRLTANGRREEAAEIKGLPRPSVALWALNRLAREHFEIAARDVPLRQPRRYARLIGRVATSVPQRTPERAAEAQVVAGAAELPARRRKPSRRKPLFAVCARS